MRGWYSLWVAIVALLMAAIAAPEISAAAQNVQAGKRVALVIGNGLYRHVPALPNPVNDAADVAGALKRLEFSVSRLTDVSYDEMRRGLIAFGREAAGADMAVIFFAGHGMEIGGENWLIPVDAELKTDTSVENEAIGLRTLVLQVSNAGNLGLVILDACRNNPFAAKMRRTVRTRAVEHGLSRVEPVGNVLVAYAARDGTTAQDGSGRNSPFTASLLRNMETPGLEITFMFRNVRDDVLEATKNEQQPFVYGSLSKKAIYLAKPAAADPGAVDEAGRVWLSVRDTTSVAVLENFVGRYAGSVYGGMARARLQELRQLAATTATPAQSAAPPSPIEAALVGLWEILVPNNRGVSRWTWRLLPDGTYRFRSEGPGAVPAHEGTLTAMRGRWGLRASKGLPGLEDGGSYELRDPANLVVSGRFGTGVWRRVEGAGRAGR